MKDLITVEYSLKQGFFHIDCLSRVLELNRRNVAENHQNSYMLLTVCETKEEADEFIRQWKELGYAHNYHYLNNAL